MSGIEKTQRFETPTLKVIFIPIPLKQQIVKQILLQKDAQANASQIQMQVRVVKVLVMIVIAVKKPVLKIRIQGTTIFQCNKIMI